MTGRAGRVVVLVVACLLAATPAAAQGLNDVIVRLLSNNCTGLGITGGNTSSLSPDLARICAFPGTGGGSSAGGSSVVEDRVGQLGTEALYRRLRERREQAASADTALGGGFSLFATAEYQNLNKDNTRFETGFRQDTAGGTFGGDYAFGRAVILGAAVTYAHQFGDYDGVGGGYDHNRYGVFVYGSTTPLANAFVEGTVGYLRTDYSFDRRASLNITGRSVAGSTSADTHGDEIRAGLNMGYDFVFGRFTLGPRIGVNYRDTEIDAFKESGHTGLELAYDEQHNTSLTTVGGLFGSMAISTGIGVFIPQANAEYIHEFLDNQRSIGFSFVGDTLGRRFLFQTDRPDRDYFTVGVGTVLVLPGGYSPFINYRELLGYRDRTSHTVTAGLRFSF